MRTVLSFACGAAFLALTLVLPGCSKDSSNPYSSTPTGSSSTPPPNTVWMQGMSFAPVTITVTAGTTITWINKDSYPHTSTSNTGVWNTGSIAGGGSATTTFNTVGTFPYHCSFHAGMNGTVIVK